MILRDGTVVGKCYFMEPTSLATQQVALVLEAMVYTMTPEAAGDCRGDRQYVSPWHKAPSAGVTSAMPLCYIVTCI